MESYSLSDYENDNAAFFSKNQEEPFLYKLTNVLYPNPEFLSDSIPENISSHRVNLCIFYIDYSCVLPFVKYAVLKNDDANTVDFVEFEKGNTTSENLETLVINQLESLFENAADRDSNDLFSNSYKGFIVKHDDIYMFFDITSLLITNHKMYSAFVYAVADELCNTKSVFNYDLGQNINNMFDVDEDTFPKCAIVQPWFYNVDGLLELIELPRVGYICDANDNMHSLTEDELREIFVPVDCMGDYDDHGFLYYFSENLINPIENETYIRVVIFTMKVGASLDEECNSVAFKLRKTQVWGIKSIDQFIPV